MRSKTKQTVYGKVPQETQMVGPQISKSLILLSGGLDSSSLLAWLVGMKYNPTALSFRYGSRHQDKETEAAIQVAEYFNVNHRIMDLPDDIFELSHSAMFSRGTEVPERPYKTDELVTEVPNRNGILLNIAASYAMQIKADSLFFAAHRGDHEQWPYRDCHPEFLKRMGEALLIATNVRLYAPFLMLTKADIVNTGDMAGAPFDLTWSCYKGDMIHCGVCATCIDRKTAFENAGIEDPTEYLL